MHTCVRALASIWYTKFEKCISGNNVQYGRAQHYALQLQPNATVAVVKVVHISRTQCNCLIFSMHPHSKMCV